MVSHLEVVFPGLVGQEFRITSPTDGSYNCIAWAAGDTTSWWWPHSDERKSHWPAEAPRERTLDAFRLAFVTLGYLSCDVEEWEEGYEKVALYVDERGLPTHAARQLPTGRWTSKLGQSEDIEHSLHDVEGELYGRVALILRRGIAHS